LIDCAAPASPPAGLGGSLASITKEQVAKLPELINVLLGAPAGSVEVSGL
jgi:hypothetical protein